MNPDTWRGKESKPNQTSRAVRSIGNGLMDGRLAQAKPVRALPQHQQEPDDEESGVWIGDDEPDYAPHGKLWFDTDEPVP